MFLVFWGGQAHVELPNDGERILVGLVLPAHPFEVFVYFVVTCVVAHHSSALCGVPFRPALPLFATGLVGSVLLGWRRKKTTIAT